MHTPVTLDGPTAVCPWCGRANDLHDAREAIARHVTPGLALVELGWRT